MDIRAWDERVAGWKATLGRVVALVFAVTAVGSLLFLLDRVTSGPMSPGLLDAATIAAAIVVGSMIIAGCLLFVGRQIAKAVWRLLAMAETNERRRERYEREREVIFDEPPERR